MDDTESDLVRRAAHGDEAAFHRLVDRHAPHLFALACALLGHTGDAEDVVQETFLAAYQGLRRFEARSAVRTWLVAILARQAALWRRRHGTRVPQSLETIEHPAGSERPHATRVDARLDVAQVLGELSPDHREVLVLREYEGLSYDEIAAALGVPRGTVESRLHRARQELRERLSGYRPE